MSGFRELTGPPLRYPHWNARQKMRNQLIMLIQEREAARIAFWEKKHRLEALLAEVPPEDKEIVLGVNRLFLKRHESIPVPVEPEEPLVQEEEEDTVPEVSTSSAPQQPAPKQKTEAQKASAKRKRERAKEKAETSKRSRLFSPSPKPKDWEDPPISEEMEEEDEPKILP